MEELDIGDAEANVAEDGGKRDRHCHWWLYTPVLALPSKFDGKASTFDLCSLNHNF
jgi:hypothetical protein